MITPGTLPLVAQRWTPFAYTIDFAGIDFTGATMSMHVRLYADAPGEPIIALANASPSSQGLSVAVATADGVPTSTVQIRINEATLEAVLLNAGLAGAPVKLAYDMHITGGGFEKTRWLEGDFTIRPGVTQ